MLQSLGRVKRKKEKRTTWKGEKKKKRNTKYTNDRYYNHIILNPRQKSTLK